jgi:predicted esterase
MAGFSMARYLLLHAILAIPSLALAADGPVGPQNDLVFPEYSPFSRSTELVKRLLSPLTELHLQQQATLSGKVLRDQSVDLAQAKFDLYVPAQMPPGGYALMVFVPPWDLPVVPSRWMPVLERHGLIFVTAANSGNDTSTLDRRAPLALIAAQNVMNRYPVDPRRVYIGGLSGGSRVALRLALGYPDLFHGVLLNAGSGPIGKLFPVPPAGLFRQFQETMRVVFLTGGNDDFNLGADVRTRRSMQEQCVFDVDTETMPFTGHEVVNPEPLDRALDALARHDAPDPARLAVCRARIDKELTAQLKQAEDLLAGGKLDEARTLLDEIDDRFGGLAAPRSVELERRVGRPR